MPVQRDSIALKDLIVQLLLFVQNTTSVLQEVESLSSFSSAHQELMLHILGLNLLKIVFHAQLANTVILELLHNNAQLDITAQKAQQPCINIHVH